MSFNDISFMVALSLAAGMIVGGMTLVAFMLR
jgi:hypothetical protein